MAGAGCGHWPVQGDYRLAGRTKGLSPAPAWEIFLRALIFLFQMMLYRGYIVLLIIVLLFRETDEGSCTGC
jgi:hypothetical protein